MKIIPVIISGGMGTRLWPVSREWFPKPFIKLKDGESFLQKTYQRACSIADVEDILAVINRNIYFQVCAEFEAVANNKVQCSYLLEPFGRNTAAAIAAAASFIEQVHGENSVMLILPADHLIEPLDGFQSMVIHAAELARKDRLVTFGIKPTSPETGFGYIEFSPDAEISTDAYLVSRFTEKPSQEVARQFLASGCHLWNSGMFCFTAKTILQELQTHASDVLIHVKNCMTHSKSSLCKKYFTLELNEDLFQNVPDNSIDYAVFEKSNRVVVVPGTINWNDIGSWAAMSSLIEPDERGNRIDGEALIHEIDNCYIYSKDRIVSAVGVENLVIVDTPDALLVAERESAKDVKHIVAQLKAKAHESCKIHKTVFRPWGSYTVIEEGPFYKVKRLVVKPGASLSLQKHHHRSEHWVVIEGFAEIVNGEEIIHLNANQSTYIPAGNKHRLTNNHAAADLVLIEVQVGEYLGEDDIVRFEDQYDRVIGT